MKPSSTTRKSPRTRSSIAAAAGFGTQIVQGKRRSQRTRKRDAIQQQQPEDDIDLQMNEGFTRAVMTVDHPRPSKKRRKPKCTFKIPFDDLCGGIIQVILSMVPTARDLFHMSQCSKRLRSLITYEHIVRSAIVGGNRYVARSMDSLVTLINQQLIYVPTPMRMLRIANGRCCELGDQCWGYELRNQSTPKVNVVRNDAGIFICTECDASLFTTFKGDLQMWASDATNSIRPPNTSYFFPGRAITLHQTENVTNRAIGPYLTLRDYKQVQNTNPILRSHDDEARRKEKTKLREEDLKEILNAAKTSDPNFNMGHANGQESFRIVCDSAYKTLKARQEEEKEKRNSKDRQRNARKHKKIQAMHAYLSECIGDTEWKDAALACEWDDPTGIRYYYGARYSSIFVAKMMSSFLLAPSTKTNKAIKTVSEKISELFNNLYEKKFFSYSFLSLEDRWEKAFREYAIAELPAAEFLKLSFPLYEPSRGRGNEKEQAQLFRQFIVEGNLRDAFSSVTCTDHRNILVEIFACVVHDAVDPDEDRPMSHELFSQADFREFSKSFFIYSISNMGFNVKYARKSLDDLKETLNTIRDAYNECHFGILDYLNSERTRNFIEEENPNDNDHDDDELEHLSNAEVVRRALLRRIDDIVMIQGNNFGTLRSLHRRYARNQHSYGQRFLHEENDG